MFTYITRRLLQGIVVLLAVSFICFIIFMYSGDPVLMLAGRYATVQEREEVRKAYGLDKPFYVQYVRLIAETASSAVAGKRSIIRPSAGTRLT